MALRDLMTGYGGFEFPLPEIAGRYAGKSLLIVADAECVWRDLEAFGCRSDEGRGKVFKKGWDFLTINKMVEMFPGRIEHCYSNEPKLLRAFIAARRNEYEREFSCAMNQHSCNQGVQWRWPWGGHGTSGLGGCLVGIGLGYERIVLCGMPLDDGPHNGEPHWRKTGFASSEACDQVGGQPDMHWKRARDLAFDGKVKSMSGRTQKWLGDASEWR